jgi:hypothetical protein
LFSQPAVTSFSPASGPVGTAVTITGTGFSSTANNNIVFFGDVRATVISSTSTSLSVAVPVGASHHSITVTTAGLTGSSRLPFYVTFPSGGTITNGSFATRLDKLVTVSPMSLVVKDLDNDGIPDIISGNIGSNFTTPGMSVYKNNSSPSNISIANPITFSIPGNGPYYMACEDVDGDGKPDIIIPNFGTSISVFKNSSAGGIISFAPAVNFPTTAGYGITVADFDGDGKPDIASTNDDLYGKVSILRNLTTGGIINFAAAVDYPTGIYPRQVSTGYINDDDLPDLIIANQNNSSFSVFANTGTSGNISFAPKIDFNATTGGNPEGVNIADFDRDGKADVVVTNNNPAASISIFRNTGSGSNISFDPKIELYTNNGWYPFDVRVSDIDGDARPDLVVSSGFSSAISVFRNTSISGSLSFNPKVDLLAYSSVPWGIAVGDIDHDGKPDICSASTDARILSIFRNTIEAPNVLSFTPTEGCTGTPITITGTNFTGATAVRVGFVPVSSFNVISDTQITAVISSGATGNVSVTSAYGTGSRDWFTYTGSCGLVPQILSINPSSGPPGTLVTINGHHFSTTAADNIVYFGGVKAVVSSSTDTTIIVTAPIGSLNRPLTVTTNNLTGSSPSAFNLTFDGNDLCDKFTANSFAFKQDYAIGASPYGSVIFDEEGNGKNDVVSVNLSSNNISSLKNKSVSGANDFYTHEDFNVGGQPNGLEYGDMDGDGKLDIAIVNYASNTVSVLRNTSTGGVVSYAPKVDFSTGNNPRNVAIKDVDADGKPDLIVTNFSSNTVSVLRNISSSTGEISFASQVVFGTANGPTGLFVADVDNDGKPDIALTNYYSNLVSVFKNVSTSPSNIAFNAKIDFPTGDYAVAVCINDLDNDGRPELLIANYWSATVSVLKNISAYGAIVFDTKIDYPTGLGTVSVAVADLDGDQKPEIVTSNYLDLNISVFKNTGSTGILSYDPRVDYFTGFNPRSISLGDIDGDGKPDMAAVNYSDNTVSILRNTMGTVAGQMCPNGNSNIVSNLFGTSYQWQVNTGSGFYNISNNANYSGTNTNTLTLNTIPTSWYGYQFRCFVDGNVSATTTLTFVSNWKGSIDSNWDNAGNWSCNQVPDANSDVVIGCSKAVQLNSNATCRSLTSKQGSSVIVKTGVHLTITH